MKKLSATIISLTLFLGLASVPAFGGNFDYKPPKDTRSQSQRNFDRNMRNANEASKRMEREAARNRMRDRTHENRIRTGKNTSIGGKIRGSGAEINVRRGF